MSEFKNLADVLDHIYEVLTTKNSTYGFANRKVGLALSRSPLDSLVVRLMEKVIRIDNILKGPLPDMNQVQEEFLDIAGYGVIGGFEAISNTQREEDKPLM